MSDAVIVDAVDLEKSARSEWAAMARSVRYARGQQKLPWLPDDTETEYRDLAMKSATCWIDLVLRAQTQGLHVDGYGRGDSVAWEQGWRINGMDARQSALYYAVLVCGVGWILELPSDDGVWMRPVAAGSIAARFEDEQDEWPSAVLHTISADRWDYYDAAARWRLVRQAGLWSVESVTEHGLGVTPAVRLKSSFDLLGRPQGEVAPLIPTQDRIVDATFTLQMVAKYGAFPQRWIAGLNPGEPLRDSDGDVLTDGDGNPLMPQIKAYVDHILLAADPDTKFGQFQAADLGQYVAALEAHIRHLAAVSQTPPHYLLGSLVNLSAEALAAAEAGLQRRIAERRMVLGEGLEQSMRLAALILGDVDGWSDLSAQVRWRDVGSRSLAQTADALLKLRDVGVPPRMLFGMIPGWSDADVDEAMAALNEGGSVDALMRELVAGQTSFGADENAG